jgi:uncharacterized membrane protein
VKKFIAFVGGRLLAGVLIVIPVYLAILLLLKATQSLVKLLQPIVKLAPDWLPLETDLSLLLVLLICFLVGLIVQTRMGQAILDRIENAIFQRIPGYKVLQSLAQRLGGQIEDQTWKPALAEIEDALVPCFIIEELQDGRYTIFVPSVPTPFAGATYVLSPERVHPVNVSFTKLLSSVTRWGSGSKDLVAAIEAEKKPPSDVQDKR